MAGSFRFLHDVKKSFLVGLGLCPRGEIALVVVKISLLSGIITGNLFTADHRDDNCVNIYHTRAPDKGVLRLPGILKMAHNPQMRDNIAYFDDTDNHPVIVDHDQIGMTVAFEQPYTFRYGGAFFYGYMAPGHEIRGGPDSSADKAVYTGSPFSAPDTHFRTNRRQKIIRGNHTEEMSTGISYHEIAAPAC